MGDGTGEEFSDGFPEEGEFGSEAGIFKTKIKSVPGNEVVIERRTNGGTLGYFVPHLYLWVKDQTVTGELHPMREINVLEIHEVFLVE